MQSITPLTSVDLLAKVQRLRYKFEIHVGTTWVNLCDLDGEYYLKNISVTPSGPGTTPEVIAGSWSAEIKNPDGIFHPLHPASDYTEYFRIGREVRISVGGNYGGTDYYRQQLIGYMDAPKFNHKSRTVSLSGCDYAKRLADFQLRSPDNYWGAMETYSSVQSTDVVGSELYSGADAVSVTGELDNMTNWSVLSHASIASVEDDEGSGDLGGYNGEITKTDTGFSTGWAARDNVAAVSIGKLYKVTFWYKRVTAGCTFSLRIFESGTATGLMGKSEELSSPTWASAAFYFTATKSCNIRVTAVVASSAASRVCRFDLVSIKEVTSYANTRYSMPETCNGPYYVVLDGVPLWYGDTDPPQGWLYDEALKSFYFADGYYVAGGTNNLLVYHYTDQAPENVVADLLANGPDDAGGGVGLYANRAAALAAMDYVATGIIIKRVGLELLGGGRSDTEVSGLSAIRMLCERVNYRFWFAYDGTPCFKPAPVAAAAVFEFTSIGHLAGLSTAQDLAQIKNRISIEGLERAMYAAKEDKASSRFKATASDPTSIAAYLEHTETIQNKLFQDQDSIDAMCAARLAERKDPKWYADIDLSKCPVPLEVGDTISWMAELETGGTPIEMTGIICSINLSKGKASYKCELVIA